MKYNLIFSGIPESPDRLNENCEPVLNNFINSELGIEENIDFQNVHRLRQREDGKPRSIIAKFIKYSDHERVLEVAREKLKDNKQFSLFQQYPAEISNKAQGTTLTIV